MQAECVAPIDRNACWFEKRASQFYERPGPLGWLGIGVNHRSSTNKHGPSVQSAHPQRSRRTVGGPGALNPHPKQLNEGRNLVLRNILATALLCTTSALAGPALAGPGGGHGGSPMAGANIGIPGGGMAGPARTEIPTRVNSQASMHASPMATLRSGTRSPTRIGSARAQGSVRLAHTARVRTRANASAQTHSQGLMHASFTAIERASSRSALARSAVQTSALPGLHTGLTVKGNGGNTIGTVNRIVTGADGKIRLVVATSTTGRTVRLAPNTLSISGGVVTTTML